jgi:tetratricopeptide (TPR) repeat protein
MTSENAFRDSVQLLQKLHRLIAGGQDGSDEGEAVRAEMDPLWYAMSEAERDRLKGLSEDLYILAEGGARQTSMSADEKARWNEEATTVLTKMFAGQDVDAALTFLRKPIPNDVPLYVTPFMQARCWEQLGEIELALKFLQEAERLDPHQAVCVVILLQKNGQIEEAAKHAERIIDNKESTSEELYQAASALLCKARQMNPSQMKENLQGIVSVLERALRLFLTTSREAREIPIGDRYIITMLGFVHQLMGNKETALRLYNDGLARYPNEPTLLTFRGLARIDGDEPSALRDFQVAVHAGARSRWAYYFLARNALRNQNYLDAWEFSLRAIELAGQSRTSRNQKSVDPQLAQLYEWLGIAMAEMGQPKQRILENLKKAESLDPQNGRIRANIGVAEARSTGRAIANGWRIESDDPWEEASPEEFHEDQPLRDLFIERSDVSLTKLSQV